MGETLTYSGTSDVVHGVRFARDQAPEPTFFRGIQRSTPWLAEIDGDMIDQVRQTLFRAGKSTCA